MLARAIATLDPGLERDADDPRSSLLNFVRATMPHFKADPFHVHLCGVLDQVISGEIDRLIVLAPPQHGKSEMVAVRLPAYWLGRRPNDPIVLTSYAAELAQHHSRAVRDVINSDRYQELFPGLKLRQDSHRVSSWQLSSYRGGLIAAGAGGPITGKGGLLGIIDDPFKNWDEAQSAAQREKVLRWYRTTFRTRIREGGAIVFIMTRWNEDDLAGELIREGGWEVLRLPAIAETDEERADYARRAKLPAAEVADPLGRAAGEPLAPSLFSADALARLRADVGTLAFMAEYQQRPSAPEGNWLKRSWFRVVDSLPFGCRLVRYWDKAGTQGGGAYTAGVLVAEYQKHYYIVDIVRGQWSAGERERRMLLTAEDDRELYGGGVVYYIEQEPGSGGLESAQATIRNFAGYTIRADRPTGSKDVRLMPLAVQAEAGNVSVLRAIWNGAFFDEVTAIPTGKYRDQTDAAAGAFNKLAEERVQIYI